MSGGNQEPITEKEIYSGGDELLQPDTCPGCGSGEVNASFADSGRHTVKYSCSECNETATFPYYKHLMFMGMVEKAENERSRSVDIDT